MIQQDKLKNEATYSANDGLETLRVVNGKSVLGLEGNASTVGTATLVRNAECRSGAPSSGDQVGGVQARGRQDGLLKLLYIVVVNLVGTCSRKGILPDERSLLRHLRSEVTNQRTHVSVKKLD